MFAPPEKISRTFQDVVEIMSCRSVSARKLARVTARIISSFLIMGDVCKLMTKALHRLIECRKGWNAQVVLDSDVLVELIFWREHLQSLNRRSIWRKHVLPSRVVYSDASAVGCAAFISMNDRPVSYKNWDAVDSVWDPFTVDCFANSVNAKVSRFYSLFYQPGSLGVDSLAFDWGRENCWLVPPVYLIPRVILHFLYCQSHGVLVVPFWPSSLFWPYLINQHGVFRNFVVDCWFVQNSSDVFVQGANKETCFGSLIFITPVLFLKLDGSQDSLLHWE